MQEEGGGAELRRRQKPAQRTIFLRPTFAVFKISFFQHNLVTGVRRDRTNGAVKVAQDRIIPVMTEHDVFAVLGLQYRPPTDRNA